MPRFIAMLAFFSLPFITLASPFYTAEVMVSGTDKQAETRAKQQGLKEILVRVSGKEQTLNLPEVEASLGKVSQFINQISYANAQDKRVGIFVYDKNRVLELLKQAKATFWDQARPEVLVWLVDENNNRIIWDHDNAFEVKALRLAGIRRGLPVLVPLGDQDDSLNISLTDLSSNFVDSIQASSFRYRPIGVVIAKINNADLSWAFFPSVAQMHEVPPLRGMAPMASGFDAMVAQVSEFYANQYAVSMEDSKTQLLVFELHNINQAADFYLAEKLLAELHSVANVSLRSVSNGTITFDLAIYDDADNFEQELAKYREMRPLQLAIDELYLLDKYNVNNEAEVAKGVQAEVEQIVPKTLVYRWL